MAIGKGRSSRRTSTTSYSSTITPIAFVALCLLGVWLLSSSSSSSVPPKTTTRTTTDAAVLGGVETMTQTAAAASGLASSVINSITTSSKDEKTPPAFEDHPGDLPEDAIKSSDRDNEEEKPREIEKDEQLEAASTAIVKDLETENDQTNKVVLAEQESGDLESTANDKKPDITAEVKNADNLETQTTSSDGSSVAQTTEPEPTTTANEKNADNNNNNNNNLSNEEIFESKNNQMLNNDNNLQQQQQQQQGGNEHQDSQESKIPESQMESTSEASKNMISDEDQRKRLEQQQQQEDDQMQQRGQPQQGITSEDQIQHDEATVSGKTEESLSSSSTNPNNPEIKQEEKAGETKEPKKAWSTQAVESVNQKERTKTEDEEQENRAAAVVNWQLCNVTAGADYIPCLDNEEAIKKLRSRRHFEHRERHCPEEPPTCLVPLPRGYKRPIEWPQSRDKIWYHNVPHTLLADVKGHQNWMKVSGEFLVFPGGGTQFIHGALHYIDFLQQAVPDIAWGKRSRVILDVGCGVASFGGYIFERDVLTMSFAPKDEHEAQIQFALERGIPAISAVMGSQRLPFPSGVFDIVHCARCRVPWHAEDGTLLLELNRVLRPGGYFVWSATPVYQKLEEDVQIWKEMSALTVSMCWELITIQKDKLNSIGAAIYHKPESNDCYNRRKTKNPPMCKTDDDPNAAWYVPLQACLHTVPTEEKERGSNWPKEWPERLQTPPYWLNRSQMGIYGKPAPDDFAADYEHWKHVVSRSYMSGLGINWSNVRNIMDMRAVYGGFAAALKDLKVWVMNVVNVDSPDTLPIIYERGLFGIYHDWCESFSTYPRTYDLLHADHLLSRLKSRCKIAAVMAEVDRIVRPGGKFIMQDDSSTIREVEDLLKSMHWEVRMTFYQKQDGMLSAQKTEWRPETYAAPS